MLRADPLSRNRLDWAVVEETVHWSKGRLKFLLDRQHRKTTGARPDGTTYVDGRNATVDLIGWPTLTTPRVPPELCRAADLKEFSVNRPVGWTVTGQMAELNHPRKEQLHLLAQSLARQLVDLGFSDRVKILGDLAHVLDRDIAPDSHTQIAPVKRNPVAQGSNTIGHGRTLRFRVLPSS